MKRKSLPTYRAEIQFYNCDSNVPEKHLQGCLAVALSDAAVPGLAGTAELVPVYGREMARRIPVVRVWLVSDRPEWSFPAFQATVESMAAAIAELAVSPQYNLVSEPIRTAVIVYDRHTDLLEFDAEEVEP